MWWRLAVNVVLASVVVIACAIYECFAYTPDVQEIIEANPEELECMNRLGGGNVETTLQASLDRTNVKARVYLDEIADKTIRFDTADELCDRALLREALQATMSLAC